ncbi:hypothetical protein GGR52DRAFT_493079 [Hypoxylon sp. FL1284]|nr:hypothetical protein GGR52DRAFT_493079 [Hypoxylon sp. FL1284]
MEPRRYPAILPAGPVQQETSASGNRRSRLGACSECRQRKVKCDGQRPRCSNCVRRAVRFCLYVDKPKAGPEAMEAVELLKILSKEHAAVLLGALRSTDDPATALSIFKERADVEGTAPARSQLELELMANNPAAYPPLSPIDASELASSNLLRPVRSSAAGDKADLSSPIKSITTDRQFILPINAREKIGYYDASLHALRVEFWTDIPVTNDFAAQVISLYIATDHPVLGLFHPDLLVADLVSCRNKFCSRFLFHALMYLGCQMYNAFNKDSMQHATNFYEEAERLWKEENDSYLTMAGAVLLSLSLLGNGRDHAVLYYAMEAMRMGERLGLFEAHEDTTTIPHVDDSEEDAEACRFAAWGAFNWNVLVSLFYRQPGSETPKSAPLVPIPGEPSPTQRRGGTSEEVPTNKRQPEEIFPAVCHFWRIIHGARWIYYDKVQDSPPKRYKAALVEHTFRELIAWAETLPPSLLRTQSTSHHVTVLHIWLHAAILDIFRPIVVLPFNEKERLGTFSAWDSSSDTAYAASVNQLKHLVVEYRSKSVASTYSILWHTGLLYLANAMLKDTKDPEWRLYLLLCIYGYESLSRPYRISELIVQGLLSMTMQETDMTGIEAQTIINEIKEGRPERPRNQFEDKIRATFMLDMDLSLKNPEAAKAENLADKFESLSIFQDFLDQEKMETEN